MGSCSVHHHRGCFVLSRCSELAGDHRQHLARPAAAIHPRSAALHLAPGAICLGLVSRKGHGFPVKRAQVFLQSWWGVHRAPPAADSQARALSLALSGHWKCLGSLCWQVVSLLREVPAMAVLSVHALSHSWASSGLSPVLTIILPGSGEGQPCSGQQFLGAPFPGARMICVALCYYDVCVPLCFFLPFCFLKIIFGQRQ